MKCIDEHLGNCDGEVTMGMSPGLGIPIPECEEHKTTANAQECLRGGQIDNPCKGDVTMRASFAGTGTPIWECEHHMDESHKRNEETNRRYPEHQPADFDPAYAGESWYED